MRIIAYILYNHISLKSFFYFIATLLQKSRKTVDYLYLNVLLRMMRILLYLLRVVLYLRICTIFSAYFTINNFFTENSCKMIRGTFTVMVEKSSTRKRGLR